MGDFFPPILFDCITDTDQLRPVAREVRLEWWIACPGRTNGGSKHLQ
jgi:hypothetical protein